jgi:hypothetical protein
MTDLNDIISIFGPRLDEAANKFFFPLQTTRVLNREAFEDLENMVRQLSKELKNHNLVPKSLLNKIYSSMQILRNEAPYFKGETTTLENMANQLETSLGLILIGETRDDRTPGVPRIL